ncbi:hypothetical protein [Tenacibaculum sp.]|uniref:hypothetical protein n=1 Tax=Tenacibaculum sp. TaxID=1906242 RepID=UPI003AA82AEF
MKTITNKFKIALLAVGFLVVGTVSAQTTDATSANITKANADGETIRLIDNKGTIKYLQSNNGITTITSTTAGNRTTTTWQLGGTLNENTYIDVDGNAFALDGIELVTVGTGAGELQASTDATTESDHGTGTGFTILVRDEATGATKKLLATDLIQSGREEYTADAAAETANSATITVTGMPLNASKVLVYRNGAKLRAGTDYTLTTDTVTLVPQTTAPYDWNIYADDFFEVHWIK